MKKKIQLFLALLIVTSLSYSQNSQLNLIPKQELNKRWSFDSLQVRILATKLNDLYYCDSLINLKDQQLVIDSLIISKKDKQLLYKDTLISLHQDQINYQYNREVKRHILSGIVITILLGLLISK